MSLLTEAEALKYATEIFTLYRNLFNEQVLKGPKNDHACLLSDQPVYIEGPNPYYGKTKSGYVLEWSYGSPHKLHTPLGEFTYFRRNCVGLRSRGTGEKVDQLLIEALGLTLGKPKEFRKGSFGGEIGPFYKVIGNEKYPAPPCVSPMLDGLELDSLSKMESLLKFLQNQA